MLQTPQTKTRTANDRQLKKVRTGCITCKIRKVKCDEGKPACKRCTDTGRTCDGYAGAAESKTSQTSQTILRAARSIVSIASAGPSHPCSPIERQWMLYFSQHLGPALSTHGDVSFWCQILPQMSVSEPAIRHALLAVGSSHARFQAELVADESITRRITPAGRDFSIRHYNVAIRELRAFFSGQPRPSDASLVCCLLFTCLECLLGDRVSVLSHIGGGLDILRSVVDKSRESSTTQKVRQIFESLDAQSTLWGKPATQTAERLDMIAASMLPGSFTTLSEAQSSLEAIISLTLNFVQTVRCGLYVDEPDQGSGYILQQRIQEKLLIWKYNLDQLEWLVHIEEDCSRLVVTRLRVQHAATLIFVSTCIEADETAWDVHRSGFQDLVGWARLLSEHAPMPTGGVVAGPPGFPGLPRLPPRFSLHVSIIPALYMTAIKCRDPLIRREAISLLEKNPTREGIWDAKLHAAVARRVVQIEEQSLSLENGVPAAMPDEHCLVYRADVEKVFDKPIRSARATFFTAPEGLFAPWKAWTEDVSF